MQEAEATDTIARVRLGRRLSFVLGMFFVVVATLVLQTSLRPGAAPGFTRAFANESAQGGAVVVVGTPVEGWWTPSTSQVAFNDATGVPIAIRNRQAMKLALIPPGAFQMGSPPQEPGRDHDEGPRRRVELSRAMYIGATEVTNAEYRRFRAGHTSGVYKGLSLNGDSQPVVNVRWQDAVAYCVWLTTYEHTARTLPPDWAYRLPTEAEWEYAARAGSPGRYWWGENEQEAGRHANVADASARRFQWSWDYFATDDGHPVSAPVGSYRPNGLGLYDMLGNVWEWCGDWYGKTYYARSQVENPWGPALGSWRVLRGGSWYGTPRYCRSALRHYLTPDLAYIVNGFRVVAAPI